MILSVLKKEVDAGATYDDARAAVAKTYPEVFSKLRVVAYTREIPNDTVSARGDLDPVLKQKIKTGLMQLSRTPEGSKVLKRVYGISGLMDFDAFFRSSARSRPFAQPGFQKSKTLGIAMMLRLEQVSKTYSDGTRALRNVSLEIESGEFVVVLGKSGAGKSTLLRCINRLVEPTSGKVFFDGQEVTSMTGSGLRFLRQNIGMIFQNYNLVPRLSVQTNVLSGALGRTSPWIAWFNHFGQDEINAALHNLDRLEIGDKAAQRADQLSGGQQQRVGIARALMQHPKIILADEPVASLDPATSRTILDILRRINREDGVTVLCNLHLPELAREYAQRLIAMKDGEIVYDGPPESLTPSFTEDLYEMKQSG